MFTQDYIYLLYNVCYTVHVNHIKSAFALNGLFDRSQNRPFRATVPQLHMYKLESIYNNDYSFHVIL